jgi:N-acetylmuramoyl-L-alanine amidase
VLIETGFITNLEEERFLNTEEGQDIIASSIYRAFKQYKARIEGRSNFTIQTGEQTLTTAAETPEKSVQDTDAELIFCVQVAALGNRVDPTPERFNGYTNIELIEQGRTFKYVINEQMTYHEALDKCTEAKNDFPGAFVVAVRNGKIVPLGEALKEINQ